MIQSSSMVNDEEIKMLIEKLQLKGEMSDLEMKKLIDWHKKSVQNLENEIKISNIKSEIAKLSN